MNLIKAVLISEAQIVASRGGRLFGFAVVEKRQGPRQRVLKAGTIAMQRDGGISCTIRNLSDGGACLDVESPIGIPDAFKLIIERDHFSRQCRVIWRSKNRIGIAFE
jgi:hypothetical protein